MRVIAYVDGFNVYYRALRRTPYKWLDLVGLVKEIFADHELCLVRYFTAPVKASPFDPQQQTKQQTYVRAISTFPLVRVHLGTYISATVKMPLAAAWRERRLDCVKVVRNEEKGSDVNIATHLLIDGFRDRYDMAAVLSSDSDLLEPMRAVRTELGKKVALVYPDPKRPNSKLMSEADMIFPIRESILHNCQLPDELLDADGRTIRKPSSFSTPPDY
jgi:uncharacterized LabA/DUF88 family protein